jgi:hypothetical protein
MRDLTFAELDAQMAEQLPARELMGSSCCRSSSCSGGDDGGSSSAAAGNGSGAGNVNILSGNQVQIAVLSPGASNGNAAVAG